jgi:hypothetical protein
MPDAATGAPAPSGRGIAAAPAGAADTVEATSDDATTANPTIDDVALRATN